MTVFQSLLWTTPLPAYMKLAMTDERDMARLARYNMRIPDFVERMNNRCKQLASAYSKGKQRDIICALRDYKTGITPNELSKQSGVPIITCRRDLNKFYDFYKALHVRQALGKIKLPEVPG